MSGLASPSSKGGCPVWRGIAGDSPRRSRRLICQDFGGDGAVTLGGEGGLVGVPTGHGLLQVLWVEGVDRRSVLAAGVIALPIALGGVVAFPEQLQQVAEVHSRATPDHAHHFRVPCSAGADLVVSRLLCLPARVANGSTHHPR